jgi:hypothetical protein
MLPRKTISWLFGSLTGFLIVLASSAVVAQTQPVPPLRGELPPLPRVTLRAQDEYIIRENLLADSGLPREKSAPDTIGDIIPQNIKLYPLPVEIVQKVPKGEPIRALTVRPVISCTSSSVPLSGCGPLWRSRPVAWPPAFNLP